MEQSSEVDSESFRARIIDVVCQGLKALPTVLAGWEGGSTAFSTVDAYSDIDLNFLVDDDVSTDVLYAAAETSLQTVSPITTSHVVPPGRYYKLKDSGEFLLVCGSFERERRITTSKSSATAARVPCSTRATGCAPGRWTKARWRRSETSGIGNFKSGSS